MDFIPSTLIYLHSFDIFEDFSSESCFFRGEAFRSWSSLMFLWFRRQKYRTSKYIVYKSALVNWGPISKSSTRCGLGLWEGLIIITTWYQPISVRRHHEEIGCVVSQKYVFFHFNVFLLMNVITSESLFDSFSYVIGVEKI